MENKPIAMMDFDNPKYHMELYLKIQSAKRLLKQKVMDKYGIYDGTWLNLRNMIDACFQIPDGVDTSFGVGRRFSDALKSKGISYDNQEALQGK